MEPERIHSNKRNRGLSLLILSLSILTCVLAVAGVVIGTGFFRISEVRAAISQPSITEEPAQAPAATPEVTPGVDPTPAAVPVTTPRPTVDPSTLEELPKLELNIQSEDQMQVFASIPDVVEAASASVVGVIQYQPNARTGRLEEYGGGSGFIVSADGYIITNAHVVSGAAAVDVLFSDGEKKSAVVLGADVNSDVAVLKMEGDNYPYLPIGDSNALRVGEYVIAIGNPISTYQFYGTVTFGIISGTAREINIDGFVNTYIQTDAAINFGNSGGPLINMAGQVIGMNAAKSVTAGYDSNGNAVSAEGIGFALPIQNVIDIANVILRDGGVVRPGIGVSIRAVDESTALMNDLPFGCRIEDITEGAPADQAGLKVGDIITMVDDTIVTENDDVVEYVREKNVGDVVEFTVYREGEYLVVPVTIGDMNKFGS